jgi:hypothetical protein
MVIVECHSGFAYADKPVAVTWQGQRFLIAEILAQGRTPQTKWFKVKTTDGQIFELFYSEQTDDWHIQPF